MATIWFCLVALMIALYVVFDGFDLGAGALHLVLARDERERGQILRSIGPVWDGNEVWLIAGGGVLYFAFPALYASSFSGFYLPLMIVLWLLILRGVAVELRNHLSGAVWVPFWDFVFCGASALLALFFGTALGNVVRGVPLDADGWFFLPLWTDLQPGPDPGILDTYTLLVGAAALAALLLHGALWIALKTPAPLGPRARRAAGGLWWGVVALTLAVTGASMGLRPTILANLEAHVWGWVFPALAVAGLGAVRWLAARGADRGAFLASCAYLLGMLSSVAFGVYPYVLPALPGNLNGLTVDNASAAPHGLALALAWWIPGILLVGAYFVFTYRQFAGKVDPG